MTLAKEEQEILEYGILEPEFETGKKRGHPGGSFRALDELVELMRKRPELQVYDRRSHRCYRPAALNDKLKGSLPSR